MRLLTRGDIPALSAEVESPLDTKSAIAIIDLRVFVPEVVSVLATLTTDSFATNLALLPFVDRLIGSAPAVPPTQGFLFDPLQPIDANVLQAINNSEIRFIHRLSTRRRELLAVRLCKLGPVQSLYGTQLEAFCSALANAIHCTQGPPGTGKVKATLLRILISLLIVAILNFCWTSIARVISASALFLHSTLSVEKLK